MMGPGPWGVMTAMAMLMMLMLLIDNVPVNHFIRMLFLLASYATDSLQNVYRG